MTNTEIKAGSKIVSVSGKEYVATGRTFRSAGSLFFEIEANEANDFKRDIEARSIAAVG